jgi:hypothetical protein
MNSAIDVHRLHFAFTITFHYIFPQLTMGLALLIVVLKSLALIKQDEWKNCSRTIWTTVPSTRIREQGSRDWPPWEHGNIAVAADAATL